MISINKHNVSDDYTINIAKNIYKGLKELDTDVIITDKYLDNNVINIINGDCLDCRDEAKIYRQGYSYHFKYNDDGNLEEITYYIDDYDLIKDNWENLVNDIIKEIQDNFGYQKSNRNELNEQENITTYVVWFDDNLEKIAKKFNTTIEDIKKLNNLTSDNLIVGEILVIPESNNIIYIVKEGDSLYRIAKRFNTTVPKLKELNNLDSNMLKIGQELIIGEKEKANNYQEYIVADDDNIYSIANKFDLTIDEIKSLNNKVSNELINGEKLKIPR